MTFDEWFKEQLDGSDERDPTLKIAKMWSTGAYESGAQSRQAEVDALKQRIGDLEDAISCSLPYIETTPTILSVLKDTLEEGWK